MEIAFSPDIPAWLSYAVVLIVAMFAAWRKVSNRLRDVSGQDSPPIWYFARTWYLFVLYVLFPLALFWFLDRTESIHDTSLFTALLVAVAFERIMSGQQANMTVSEGARSIWSPFQAYVERTSAIIKRQLKRHAERWDRRVLDCALEPDSQTPPNYPKLDKLKALAEQLTPDVAQLNTQIQSAAGQAAARGTDYVRERQARIWYAEVTGSASYSDGDAWQQLLLEEDIIDRKTYLLHSPGVRSNWMLVTMFSLIVIVIGTSATLLLRPATVTMYDMWRMGKNHSSAADLTRTYDHLTAEIADTVNGAKVLDDLTRLLRDPSLNVERAGHVLALLVKEKCTAQEISFPLAARLSEALRTQNVDIRNRINQALLFITPEKYVMAELRSWNPAPGDSLFDVESHVGAWQKVWQTAPPTTLCDYTPTPAKSAQTQTSQAQTAPAQAAKPEPATPTAAP